MNLSQCFKVMIFERIFLHSRDISTYIIELSGKFSFYDTQNSLFCTLEKTRIPFHEKKLKKKFPFLVGLAF
ncbi:unknown protein [Simkania negevensis Z]|uniref:Uncharacterized protein n=1 Tax=Simkania negevensis (strain ATCC VR-1471 / DSM 27360 / Z) TaxID=331113 RepID=F8L6Q1_SIMNZ|nr:unknown protein [Simkania negevensis Z]